MDTSAFLSYLVSQPAYYEQIAHIEHIRPRDARFAELEKPLSPLSKNVCKNHNFLPLYTHQAEAVNQARQGKNVIVVTPSASGKTLCYNIPVLETFLTQPDRRALYLFPTKALAQDQLRTLHEDFCPDLFKAT